MATKFWQLKFKGERTIDEIQAAAGKGGANLVRVHFAGGETHVYFAGDEALHAHVVEATKALGSLHEVKASVVTDLS